MIFFVDYLETFVPLMIYALIAYGIYFGIHKVINFFISKKIETISKKV